MGSMACDVLFRMPSARLYFCLLIVPYMLSDKIKGKRALKARTFLHVVRDKVHACYWYRLSMHLSTENSAGYLQRVQIFLKPLHMASDSESEIRRIFLPIRSIRSIGILQQWSFTWISLSQTLNRHASGKD